jgi:hypothetical protein
VSIATRLNISHTLEEVFNESLIKESGGDVSLVSSSYSTAGKSRRSVVGTISTRIHGEWQPPTFTTLHWDSRLTPSLSDKYISEERLTVVVRDSQDMKLFGVSSYEPGTQKRLVTSLQTV